MNPNNTDTNARFDMYCNYENKTGKRAHDYLELVGAKRGAESAERLKKDAC